MNWFRPTQTPSALSAESIISALYKGVHGRDADLEGLALYVGRLRKGTPLSEIIAEFLASPEHESRWSHHTSPRFAIRPEDAITALYHGVHSRPPDEEGHSLYTRLLRSGTPLSEIVGTFVGSPEFMKARKHRDKSQSSLLPDFHWLISLARSDLPPQTLIRELQKKFNEALPLMTAAYHSERMAKALLLKVGNAILLQGEYVRGHSSLVAKPLAFVIDPSNTCQLKCPGCIQSALGHYRWTKGLLDLKELKTLLAGHGPHAFHCNFYNWGEPLINRNLPDMIMETRKYVISTHISTNLSLSFDAEALVSSGLHWMTCSIDGTSQETLEVYRVGARMDRVLQSLSEVVAAKKKLGSYTPFIDWQFLMFDHNASDIEAAEELAKKIGVNQIRFCRPYDFAHPTITMKDIPDNRTVIFNHDDEGLRTPFRQMSSNLSLGIDEAFDEFMTLKIVGDAQPKSNNKCRWLYEQMVMDAQGRILPCCGGPSDEAWVFGNVGEPEVFNSPSYTWARVLGAEKQTACHSCPVADLPNEPNFCGEIHIPQWLGCIDWCEAFPQDELKKLWG